MHGLLCEPPGAGYPDEYVVARIRGRAASRNGGIACPPSEPCGARADDSAILHAAAAERWWLYRQMNGRLRQALAPLLFFFEIDTLVLALRSAAAGLDCPAIDAPADTLLSPAIREILAGPTDVAGKTALLERFFVTAGFSSFKGLAAVCEEETMQGVEVFLRRRFYEILPGRCGHPATRKFFRLLIDTRNAMTLAKCLRWRLEKCPAPVAGGGVRIQRWEPEDRRVVQLERLVGRTIGRGTVTAEELHPARLSHLLRERAAKTATACLHSTDPVRCCLGYAWIVFHRTMQQCRAFHQALFADDFGGTGEATT
ncbi:MAG: hypothetical protein Kow0089_02200 [Desulfobulbaceae bacterium]